MKYSIIICVLPVLYSTILVRNSGAVPVDFKDFEKIVKNTKLGNDLSVFHTNNDETDTELSNGSELEAYKQIVQFLLQQPRITNTALFLIGTLVANGCEFDPVEEDVKEVDWEVNQHENCGDKREKVVAKGEDSRDRSGNFVAKGEDSRDKIVKFVAEKYSGEGRKMNKDESDKEGGGGEEEEEEEEGDEEGEEEEGVLGPTLEDWERIHKVLVAIRKHFDNWKLE